MESLPMEITGEYVESVRTEITGENID